MPRQEYLNVSTTQMYYFIEVVECKSFTLAAHNLYTTQSNLSKTVATLEKNLNIQLFIRTASGMITTEAGMHLYHKWKKQLFDMERDLNESRVMQGGYADALSIGCLDSWLPQSCIYVVLKKFSEKYPDKTVNVYSYPAQDLRKNLFNESLDLIFTVRYDFDEMASDKIEILNVTERPLVVCMQLDNPLALKAEISVSDLKDCDFVSIAPSYVPTYGVMLENLCESYGFSPKIARYTNSAFAQPFNMMGKNDVFLCDQYYYDYGDTGFAFRPVADTKSGILAVWRKKYEKPETGKLIKILYDVAASQAAGQQGN